ncbi:FtsW/RodA/SpoVE family cell cycle protein [Clostridium massiliamazoniense]|uniref:FtsW/RodA/SpoVE family cell cycle protein n=1 Tax=Clostridium massiliamazoniense TaxID=1347366 RepID=UPI0006D78EF5|nr:FtsW/RodA/SpoVE family cell cycle protein [Clostridium massiliamazoniense]
MNTLKYEKRLLRMVYLLCIALFGWLGLQKNPIDTNAIIMGIILIVIISFSHYIIRRFYPDGDKYIFVFSSVLAVIGMAMQYSISPTIAVKQLVWLCLGIIAFMFITIFLPDLKSFSRFKKTYLIGTVIFSVMALIFGTDINGAKNWIRIGSFTFQPSEIGKLFLVLYLASALMNFERKDSFLAEIKQLMVPGIVTLFAVGCMFLQKDLGAAGLFFFLAVTVIYMATSRKRYVFLSIIFLLLGGVVGFFTMSHVRVRIDAWLHVWANAQGNSYQIVQGLYGISSGGALGLGLGQGYPQLIPFSNTDFVYAMVCEEFGMIFAIGMLFFYFFLFYRGMRAALTAEDNFSQLVGVGMSALIVIQVLVIVGGIFTIIPLTGITLPLVSYGGTSMLTIFFALGILQKISEEGRR